MAKKIKKNEPTKITEATTQTAIKAAAEGKVKIKVIRHVVKNQRVIMAPGLKVVPADVAKDLIKRNFAIAYKPEGETAIIKATETR